MTPPNRKIHSILLLLCLAPVLLCSGCSIGYVLHAAAGQGRLLAAAVPVEEGLKSPRLDAAQRERLRLVAVIKTFGEEVLSLKETQNYRTVSLASSGPPLYVVSACPKDRLEPLTWWFPFVGKMPYLGFFDLEDARARAEKLRARDLDVVIGRADAYSTLGWFKDPVTLNLLAYSPLDLAEIILHEMTHTTLYVKGQGGFNEGLASLVGKRGALMFLEGRYGPHHPFVREAGDAIRDEHLFARYLDTLLAELEDLYARALPYPRKLEMREVLFQEALARFERLRPEFHTGRYRAFGRTPINNAYLLSIGLYHRHFALFEGALEKRGGSIPALIEDLRALSRQGGDMLQKMVSPHASRGHGKRGTGGPADPQPVS